MYSEANPWQTKSSALKYSNPWLSLTEHQVVNPAGNDGIYGVVHFKSYAVGVLPLDEEDNTWLVGQYRYALHQYSWEIPEGGCPFEEALEDAAARELEEETGLKAERYTSIVTMHLSNSVTDEYGVVYLAQGLSMHHAMPEETEQLVVKKLPFDEAYQMVQQGIITDSLSVAAILKVKLMKLQGEL